MLVALNSVEKLRKQQVRSEAHVRLVENIVLSALAICFVPFATGSYPEDDMLLYYSIIKNILGLLGEKPEVASRRMINFEEILFGYLFLYVFVLPSGEDFKKATLLNVALIQGEKIY